MTESIESAAPTEWDYWVLHESGPPFWRTSGEDAPDRWNAETGEWEQDVEFVGWLLEATSIDQVTEAEVAKLYPEAVQP